MGVREYRFRSPVFYALPLCENKPCTNRSGTSNFIKKNATGFGKRLSIWVYGLTRFRKGSLLMNKRICVLLLAGILGVLTACQPTPEKDYVITKESAFLEERIAAGPVGEQQVPEGSADGEAAASAAPERWKDEIVSKNFLCRIDAEIVPPGADRFPVFRIEPAEADADFIGRFVDVCASPVAAVYENLNRELDLKEQLEAAMRGEPVADKDDGSVSFQPYDGQQEEIDRIAERLRTYDDQRVSDPEKYLKENPFGAFRIETQSGREWRIVTDRRGFSASADGANELLQTETTVRAGDAFPGESIGSTINVDLAQEDAVAEADRVLKRLGIEHMGAVSVKKARTIHVFAWTTTSTGWCIEYRRNDNNSVPVDFLSYSYVEALVLEDDPYAVPWHNESLSVYVTKDGLSMLEWKNPKKITGVLTENVALLPFEQIKENAKNLIAAGTGWTADAGFETEIEITRVFLTYGAVRPKNTNEYRYLLPVWVFEYRHNRVPNELCFFTINAVDGTRAEVVTTKMAVPR